jgi:hypothetical protein
MIIIILVLENVTKGVLNNLSEKALPYWHYFSISVNLTRIYFQL